MAFTICCFQHDAIKWRNYLYDPILAVIKLCTMTIPSRLKECLYTRDRFLDVRPIVNHFWKEGGVLKASPPLEPHIILLKFLYHLFGNDVPFSARKLHFGTSTHKLK